MGAVTRNILTITEPSIKVDPFDIPDIESGRIVTGKQIGRAHV